MKQRFVYKGFQIRILVAPAPSGGFDAQIAIVATEGTRMRWQRFLDLADQANEEEALRMGLSAGRDWIDDQPLRERSDLARSALPTLAASAHSLPLRSTL